MEHDGYEDPEEQEERPDVGEALDAVDNLEQEQAMPLADGAPPAGTIQTAELPDPVETPGGTKTVTVTPVAPIHKESLFPDAPEMGKKGLED